MRIVVVLPIVLVCGSWLIFVRNVGRSGHFCECSTYGLAVSDIATHRNGVRSVRNVVRSGHFCRCHSNGVVYFEGATASGGVRTSFFSALKMLLELLISVIALIMVMYPIVMLPLVIVCNPPR